MIVYIYRRRLEEGEEVEDVVDNNMRFAGTIQSAENYSRPVVSW